MSSLWQPVPPKHVHKTKTNSFSEIATTSQSNNNFYVCKNSFFIVSCRGPPIPTKIWPKVQNSLQTSTKNMQFQVISTIFSTNCNFYVDSTYAIWPSASGPQAHTDPSQAHNPQNLLSFLFPFFSIFFPKHTLIETKLKRRRKCNSRRPVKKPTMRPKRQIPSAARRRNPLTSGHLPGSSPWCDGNSNTWAFS